MIEIASLTVEDDAGKLRKPRPRAWIAEIASNRPSSALRAPLARAHPSSNSGVAKPISLRNGISLALIATHCDVSGGARRSRVAKAMATISFVARRSLDCRDGSASFVAKFGLHNA